MFLFLLLRHFCCSCGTEVSSVAKETVSFNFRLATSLGAPVAPSVPSENSGLNELAADPVTLSKQATKNPLVTSFSGIVRTQKSPAVLKWIPGVRVSIARDKPCKNFLKPLRFQLGRTRRNVHPLTFPSNASTTASFSSSWIEHVEYTMRLTLGTATCYLTTPANESLHFIACSTILNWNLDKLRKRRCSPFVTTNGNGAWPFNICRDEEEGGDKSRMFAAHNNNDIRWAGTGCMVKQNWTMRRRISEGWPNWSNIEKRHGTQIADGSWTINDYTRSLPWRTWQASSSYSQPQSRNKWGQQECRKPYSIACGSISFSAAFRNKGYGSFGSVSRKSPCIGVISKQSMKQGITKPAHTGAPCALYTSS